jgi:hypothetical protein
MDRATATTAIVVGAISIAIAVFNKHFYWQKGVFSNGKETPLWFGRLWFGVIGALFILFGIKSLFIP